MTDEMMSLQALLEKSSDTDLLREMIGFAAHRLEHDRLRSNRRKWIPKRGDLRFKVLAGARSKAGAGRSSTRGTPQVVIDDLDVAKSASPRLIDELILSTLALKIKLNLGLSEPPPNWSTPLLV